jgi:hypothetical protein
MTALVSAIGMLAMLAALAATMLLDLARDSDGAGPVRTGRLGRMLAGTATDRRAVGYLVVGLVLVGAVCTVIRLGRLA